MLYARWRKIAEERAGNLALHEVGTGRRWTFTQLWEEGERYHLDKGGVVFPRGHAPEFIFQLLAAWRENRLVCPLEPNQSAPFIANPPQEYCHLKTTSGTGGNARFVAFLPGQLMADADNIVATMGLRADWPNLGVISLSHSYGFSNLILPLLLQGIPLILAPAPLPEILRNAAAQVAGITLPAVPLMWRVWQEAGAIPKNVRLAISAGAPLPVPLEREVFAAVGVKIHNFLGSSECGGIAYDGTATPRTDPSLAGSPMKNVTVARDESGCLVVRSAAVGQTYWPEPADALAGGIFRTSDLVELMDGRILLKGRQNDEINVAGRKVSPETVERALLVHPGVRACVVLGVASQDAERLETICAVVVAEAGEAELRQFLLETLPAWQVPRQWHFVSTLAVNARGKISRAEWRRHFLGGGEGAGGESG